MPAKAGIQLFLIWLRVPAFAGTSGSPENALRPRRPRLVPNVRSLCIGLLTENRGNRVSDPCRNAKHEKESHHSDHINFGERFERLSRVRHSMTARPITIL